MKKLVDVNKLSEPAKRMYERFIKETNPCVNVSGNFDITHLYRLKKKGHSLNALICYSVLMAAEKIDEFHYRIGEDGNLYYYEHCKTNAVIKGDDNGLYYADYKFFDNFLDFEKQYKKINEICKTKCEHFSEDNGSLIATSAIINYPFTSISLEQSNTFWDNFVLWGSFEKKLLKVKLNMSLRFHHALIDGEHAGMFFKLLQHIMNTLTI